MHRHSGFVRTVRLTRSHSGFGFTITGQQPCVLSCIVRGSPAYEVGLRAGDLVVGVNGSDVTSARHDDVVHLIGSSGITITLQIMERQHRSRLRSSSSSGDSVDENASPNKASRRRSDGTRRRHHRRQRARPLSMHATADLPGQAATSSALPGPAHGADRISSRTNRSKEVVMPSGHSRSHSSRHSQEGSWANQPQHPAQPPLPPRTEKRRSRPHSEVPFEPPRDPAHLIFPNALVPPAQLRPSGELRPDDTYEQPGTLESRAPSRSPSDPVLRALVGYCGSVEVPGDGHGSWNKLASLRGALSRLKTEGRVHVLLILEVRSAGVRLVNHLGQNAADFPANRLAFYGAHPDDERYFGVVVAMSGPRTSFSVSIFRTLDPEHCRHDVHSAEARAWGLQCRTNSRGGCREVPSSPGSILRCLASTFGSHKTQSSSSSSRSRPQSVPPQSVPPEDLRSPPRRSHSPALRPGSVPPQRDPLEDKLSPRALLLRPSSAVPNQQAAREPQFKVPMGRAPFAGPPQQERELSPPPGLFRRFVKTGGSFRKKLLGISQSHEALPTSNPTANGAVTMGSRAASVSHNSVLLEDLHQASFNPANLSTNTTLAHSEKSVYKTVTKEPQLDEDLSRVAKWATNFDNLLNDKHGVATFTEFLKSEYSEENILFWLAADKFKRIQDEAYRRFRAQEIFSRFIDTEATESVNLDAACRDALAHGLTSEPLSPSLFEAAQMQIYNLMRLDSYVRFLKSNLYKNCMVGEMENRPLPCSPDCSIPATPERASGLKSAKSSTSLGHPDSEDKKRRSLFPWIRRSRRFGKASSGSTSGSQLDLKKGKSPSRSSSKKESDFEAVGKGHCRINFPDGSSTVVRTGEGSARQCLQAVCAKRGLPLHASELLSCTSPEKLLDLSAPASTLSGKALLLEARAVLRLEIPSLRKTLGVRAKPAKALKEVLKLTCARYSLKLDSLACWLENSGQPLALDTALKELDHCSLLLLPKDERPAARVRLTSSQEIADWLSAATFDASGLFDPQPPLTSKSGGTLREKKSERKSALRKSLGTLPTSPAPDPNSSDGERFMDILSRMNNQRLDDQRGHLSSTPLELPDFLKTSVAAPPPQESPVFPSRVAPPAPPLRPSAPFLSPVRSVAPAASPDLPFMDSSSVLTSTPRSRSGVSARGASPVYPRPQLDLPTPPPPPFRDQTSLPSPPLFSARSTPSPTTHLLLLPDSPLHVPGSLHQPSFHALEDDDRVTFV